MPDIESNTHSFVIRVWVEEQEEAASPGWRGHITHVQSSRRIYVQDLGEIVHFIAPYLEALGVQLARDPAARPAAKKAKRSR